MDDLRAVNPLQAQRLWQCNAHSSANKLPSAKEAAMHLQAQRFWRCDSFNWMGQVFSRCTAPMDDERVVGRCQALSLWRSHSSIWMYQVIFQRAARSRVMKSTGAR